jgi:hypothetical protein
MPLKSLISLVVFGQLSAIDGSAWRTYEPQRN